MSEFDLIRDFFTDLGVARDDVAVPIGDDGAVLNVPAGKQLISVTDTLVQSIHFPRTAPARAIGHRALAVNLSDVAAMGATPAWASLSISVPSSDPDWFADFAAGFSELAVEHGVQLIGGDTVRGPLVVTVHVLGCVAPEQYVCRNTAVAGDAIYVSGTLGDAAAGLRQITRGQHSGWLIDRFLFPRPQVELGRHLGKFCSAAIDISDGFGQDLNHILQASSVGAEIALEKLPLSSQLCQNFDQDEARYLAISGGDDYQLCVCVPQTRTEAFDQFCKENDLELTHVGAITAEPGLRFSDGGRSVSLTIRGHDHFVNDE